MIGNAQYNVSVMYVTPGLTTQLDGERDVLSVMFSQAWLFFFRLYSGRTNCAAPVLNSTQCFKGLRLTDCCSQTTQMDYMKRAKLHSLSLKLSVESL